MIVIRFKTNRDYINSSILSLFLNVGIVSFKYSYCQQLLGKKLIAIGCHLPELIWNISFNVECSIFMFSYSQIERNSVHDLLVPPASFYGLTIFINFSHSPLISAKAKIFMVDLCCNNCKIYRRQMILTQFNRHCPRFPFEPFYQIHYFIFHLTLYAALNASRFINLWIAEYTSFCLCLYTWPLEVKSNELCIRFKIQKYSLVEWSPFFHQKIIHLRDIAGRGLGSNAVFF